MPIVLPETRQYWGHNIKSIKHYHHFNTQKDYVVDTRVLLSVSWLELAKILNLNERLLKKLRANKCSKDYKVLSPALIEKFEEARQAFYMQKKQEKLKKEKEIMRDDIIYADMIFDKASYYLSNG